MTPYCSVIEFKPLGVLRSFDHEGKPYPIHDDDLEDIFAKSDYAKGRGRRS
jgi:hypothetical protein